MTNPSSNAVFEMLGKIYADARQNNQAKLDQDRIAQDQMNQLKQMNDEFFNLLIAMFNKNLSLLQLKSEVLKLSKEHGFESTKQALNQVQNRYGQNPLQNAFQHQDFGLAIGLMQLGAEVQPIDRAAFEMALDSQAARDLDLPSPDVSDEKLHVVKNYGLVLGINMTSVDGTSSQLAHVAPTYKMMTDAVSSYAALPSDNQNFKNIAEAFRFSNKEAQFSYSTSQNNPKAGEKIAERIQEGKVTSIPISRAGHVMGLSIVPDGKGSNSGCLVFTNRGEGGEMSGTQIFRIDDLKKVDAKFINAVMSGHGNSTSHRDVMKLLRDVTGGKVPISTIPQPPQKNENCTIANPRANIEGILLCQKALQKNGFQNLTTQDYADVKAEYKQFTHAMRADKVKELVTALKKDPKNPDLTNLAKEYLKQHPKADASLRGPLEKVLNEKRAGNTDAPKPYFSMK